MTIQEMRKIIEEELYKVSESRITLDKKNIIDNLLFDKIIIDGQIVKIPVWSGNFLNKIDLSEIDFTNVFWDYTNYPEFKKYIPKNSDNTEKKEIYYKNTNAKINLGKAYREGKKYSFIDCNFEGTDLSETNFKEKTAFIAVNCNFKNTKLILDDKISLYALSSNFENTDLSKVNINKY